MEQSPTVAFSAFADAWPRAPETEIGAALCVIGAGRTLTFDLNLEKAPKFFVFKSRAHSKFWRPLFGLLLWKKKGDSTKMK